MAASCNKWKLIIWLIEHCHSEIDVRDGESGWTALHRSLFYGQIAAARQLLLHGASLRINDHEGLTPLEIVMKDRLPYIEYTPHNPCEVYVWGSNTNFNLGVGNEQRSHPELLDIFRKENIRIKQVVMCKFHSVFLSNNGYVFTCGHGHGGRLGQNSEQTVLTPSLVKGINSIVCEEIAAGQDHLVLLMENGQVWTCGLNSYHQLGHIPPPERLLIPRQLSLKLIKDQKFIGVCAARYHTVIYTRNAVFTFGLNAGQLGHPKGEKTQISPRQVSALDHKDWKITHVATSDGAIVCSTNKGDVYVLHEYQCRKIASRQLEIKKLSVVGGHLDAHCKAANVREGGGFELRIIVLTKSGKIFLWRESCPQLRRCLFNIGRELILTDIQLSQTGACLITKDGEGFIGNLVFPKENLCNSPENNLLPSSPFNTKQGIIVSSLHTLLNRDECDLLRLKRLPSIHRAVQITSDSKGRNFAVLQCHPKIGLTDLPTLPSSNMKENFLQLLQHSYPDDVIHDVVLHVGSRNFLAHKYILASRSEYFCKLFMTNIDTEGLLQTLSIDGIKYDIFEQILQYIYSDDCDFLKDGMEIIWNYETNKTELNIDDNSKNELNNLSAYKIIQNKSKKKSKQNNSKKAVEDPIKLLRDASKRMGIPTLTKRLETVKFVGGKIKNRNEFSVFPKLQFNRTTLCDLYDVKLLSEDKIEFMCNRCILVARSEYFMSMLGCGWIETLSSNPLPLPIKSDILETLLDYLYTDQTSKIYVSEDVEFLCNTLITADLLLIDRLKAMCEIALVEIISLRNVVELLEVAHLYNAQQLKTTCMQYVCINLPAILENGCLNNMNDEIVEELTKVYHNLLPCMNKRIITPYSLGPTQEQMQLIAEQFPVDSELDINRSRSNTNISKSEGKGKSRRRTHSLRSSTDEINIRSSTDEINIKSSTDEINIKSSTDEIKTSRANSDIENIVVDVKLEAPFNKDGSNKIESDDGNNNQWSIFKRSNSVVHVDPVLLPKQSGKSGWIKKSDNLDKHVPQLKDIMLEQEIAQNQLKNNVKKTNLKHKPLQKIYKEQECTSPNFEGHNLASFFPCLDERKINIGKSWKIHNEQDCTLSNFDDHNISLFPSLNESKKLQQIGNRSNNPWNKKMITEDKPVPNLGDILKAEEKQQQLIKQTSVKSLQLIHLEDQAIEELRKLYNAEDNPEEIITIQRILSNPIVTPVWKKHSFSFP